MTHGRIETTPEQQLAELRVAYARYATLAERWREESGIDPDERDARERDARRIAHAYEKTIASTALRMESMHRTHAEAMGFTRLAKGLSVMLGVAVLAGGAAVAYLRPELFRTPAAPGRQLAVDAPLPARPPAAPVMKAAPPAAPVIAPATKSASAPVATPAARPTTPAEQNSAQQMAAAKPAAAKPSTANPLAAKPPSATAKPAPQKSAAPFEPARAQARVAASSPPPRLTLTPPVTAAAPPSKVEPLSPPKDVAPLPSPPRIEAANVSEAAPAKAAEPAAATPQTATASSASTPPASAPAAAAPSNTQSASTQSASTQAARLVPVPRTHTLPPYPLDAKRAGEQGTTQMQVTISPLGAISDCKVISTSGSQRLDATACSFVQSNWRWQPPTRDGREVSAITKVSVIWNLIAGR